MKLAAVFAPGFEKVIPSVLKHFLPDAKEIKITSGFVRFSLDKDPFRASKLDFFNNVFLIINEWGGQLSFEAMCKKMLNGNFPSIIEKEIRRQHFKSFRIRYSKANQFMPVNKSMCGSMEKAISQFFTMKTDRLGGDTEFWFFTRRENFSAFALRMTKKQSTEKYLNQGELRPEFVTLLAGFAGLLPDKNRSITILDPFAGYGGIVKQIHKMLPKSRIYASEIENNLVEDLKHHFQVQKKSIGQAKDSIIPGETVTINSCSATNLSYLADQSVDVVITDPPWGFWKAEIRDDKALEELYDGMLKEFCRVIKPEGKICILTAAKETFEKCFQRSAFAKASSQISSQFSATSSTFLLNEKDADFRTDVLVNGKKAAVYLIKA